MNNILVIAKKDFKSLVFSSPLWVISTLCSAVWSYLYLRELSTFVQRSSFVGGGPAGGADSLNIYYEVFAKHISLSNVIFLFLIPALTMKLLSEERKQKTYNLLLTVPISSLSIAVGKFLAGFGASLVLVFISLLYPLGTGLVADFSYSILFSAYLGLAFIVGAYVSVGLLSSSLTKSPLLSVMMGVILNLSILIVLGQADFLSEYPTFQSMIEYLSIGSHFVEFMQGLLQSKSIIYFISFISFFVFLTNRIIESSRWR
ncbi:MAG: ABC transporter permease subunit [Bdellovibrionales bacterium]|nr:ABC transporter permease subunit [Bdellovibrionales bacterium]